MPPTLSGKESPNIWKNSLPRITIIDMATKQRKRLTAAGVIFPHSPGSMERGSARSTEISKAITKPIIVAGKT